MAQPIINLADIKDIGALGSYKLIDDDVTTSGAITIKPNVWLNITKDISGAFSFVMDKTSNPEYVGYSNEYMISFIFGNTVYTGIFNPGFVVKWYSNSAPVLLAGKVYFFSFSGKKIWTTNLWTGVDVTVTVQTYTLSMGLNNLGNSVVASQALAGTCARAAYTVTQTGGTEFTASMVGANLWIGTTDCGTIKSITSTTVCVVANTGTNSTPTASTIRRTLTGLATLKTQLTWTPMAKAISFTSGGTPTNVQLEAREMATEYVASGTSGFTMMYLGRVNEF